MLFSNAIQGFILSKQIEGLSVNTLTLYQYHLNHFCQWLSDTEVERITSNDIKQFLYYLKTEYKPVRWNNNNDPLTNKTIKNVWICFKSFWAWGKNDLGLVNIMVSIPAPKHSFTITDPFTKQEIKALLASLKKETLHTIRDRAIILTLLDTGLRATELCLLSIADYDPKLGRLEVRHGKGDKKRFAHLGANARKAIWKYLTSREDGEDSKALLFTISKNKALERNNLGKILTRIGDKAGVKDVYPHKFRHTFAIEYLRNGGDIFTLQVLLGHSSLEMVRHYSKIAAVDTARVHQRAGPVDNWLR